MPSLPKTPVTINFSKGLDTKTDPWQVPIGNFLDLENMVFTIGDRLTKRSGYPQLTALPSGTDATFLTTFNGNLTAIGSNLQALSSSTETWVNKGNLQPCELSVLPLIRSNTNQTQVDSAIAPNGLVCTVYTDQTPTSLATLRYMYVIADSVTGQNIVIPTAIPVTSGTVTGSPRVFVLGSYFIIVFTNVITATSHLQYIAVSLNNPTMVTTNADIASSYISATTLSWDGVVVGEKLFIAYNTTTGGQAIKITYLTSTLTLVSAVTYSNAGKVTATIMSLTADVSNASSPIIWAAYYNLGSTTGYAFAVDQTLNKVLATPAEIITSGTILNLASVASAGVLTFYYEVSNTYSYDSSIATNLIDVNTCTQAGTVGTASTLVRSVGLASKAFIYNSKNYFLAEYSSTYQPTYFLINGSGQVVTKFAYGNGGGYLTLGLPSVTLNGNEASIAYLIKDFVTSQNTSTTQSITKSNIYSQTGINLASITIGTSAVVPVEIAQALHLSGGFLWEYDGYTPVEHNFYLWPDSVEIVGSSTAGNLSAQEYQYQATYEWCDNQGNIQRSAPSIAVTYTIVTAPASFTGNRTSGSPTLASVSSFTGLQVGQPISGTGIPANTYILSLNPGASSLVMSNNASSGSATSTTVTPTTLGSLTVNVPTLRLTYKIANPVKIVVYRWSTAQQNFFQTTTITTPVINSVTTDSVAFVDSNADSAIVGNSLLYTTGGVVENIGAPSFAALTLFDDRVWGIDSEDRNLLWNSKQVIETTPVEMSDLFTFYVAPSIGSQGSTGNMTCLAPMDDKLIIFKANALYYINGTGPDNTGANSQYSQPLFVTSVVGSSNQQSIVFIPDGLMFQSETAELNDRIVTNGIWLLGRGMGVSYIGAPVEALTNQGMVQSAVTIPGTTQVRFTLSSGITLMYDYFYQQWGTFSNVPAISATLYQNLHTYLNSDGLVFQETPSTYLDGSNPVLMSFTTAWINLAGLQGYQRAHFFYLLGQYLSPHYLQISIAYDYEPSPVQSVIIKPDNYGPPYGGNGSDSASPYGQQTPYGGPPAKEQWRIFFANERCQSFQLTIKEIYDPSFGIPAGPGLTISGLSAYLSLVRSFIAISNAHSVGGGTNGRGGV